MPLAPGVRLGNYEIVAPIGAGGMGEVYRARDLHLVRQLARYSEGPIGTAPGIESLEEGHGAPDASPKAVAADVAQGLWTITRTQGETP